MTRLADHLCPGDTVLVGTGTGEPLALIEELIVAADALGPDAGIRVVQVMIGGSERLADVSGGSLRVQTPVPGSKTRKAIGAGRATLYAVSMSQFLGAILDGSLPIDGVLLQGRAIDATHATPGIIADIMVPGWERARFRALELNDRIPRIGFDSPLRIADAHHVVRSSRLPNEMHDEPASEAALRIGRFVAEIVPDGATIELGVGRALAGVVPALVAARRDLAMHTGVVGDAAMRLIEAGVVSRPIRGRAFAVGATAMGTHAFYTWADAEPRIGLVDSRLAQSSDHLARQPRFVAINGALQVDLGGNVNSTSHKGRIVSGVGGAIDFATAGARGHEGGGSIIALFSTTPDGASTIVPAVDAVSIPARHVTHVVTEHGIARLSGDASRDRAQLAGVAAPEHRAALLG